MVGLDLVKQCASRELAGAPVELKAEIEFDEYRMTYWRYEVDSPPSQVAVADKSDQVYVVSRDIASVQRFLTDARPNLEDIAAFVDLLSVCDVGPGRAWLLH